MLDYHVVLGAVAVVIGLLAYVPYFRELSKRRIKPHAFSWLVWGLAGTVVFLAQTVKGGGAGAWNTVASAIINLTIFLIALFWGEKEITTLDKFSLGMALFGILLWVVTTNPLYSVIVLCFVDAFGVVPTFRKSYKRPYEESISVFSVHTFTFAISIIALQTLNLTTALFPAYVAAADGALMIMILVRRTQKR